MIGSFSLVASFQNDQVHLLAVFFEGSRALLLAVLFESSRVLSLDVSFLLIILFPVSSVPHGTVSS